MKVYCFYLIKNKIYTSEFKGVYKEDIVNSGSKDIALYAFTPEKESRNLFLKTRNNELFFEKVIDIDKEDYIEFCDTHKGQLLEYHTFQTKEVVNGNYMSMMAYILCTTHESDCILYYKEDYTMDIMSGILTDDFLDILEQVEFKKKIRKALDESLLLSEVVSKVAPLEDINYDSIIIDELSLFIKLFSNTFKN